MFVSDELRDYYLCFYFCSIVTYAQTDSWGQRSSDGLQPLPCLLLRGSMKMHMHTWTGLYHIIAHGCFLSLASISSEDAQLMRLDRVITHRLYASHHLFLSDQVVDPL